MRLIKSADVRAEIPPAWLTKAKAKDAWLKLEYQNTAGQRAADPQAWRSKWSRTVEDAKSLWQDAEMKQAFIKASNGKCWYCEASVNQRSDVPIDHFRPKNRVHEDDTHEGYWWLACDWQNYRYACTYCNSRRNAGATTGGKQDQFPLWDETKRARTPGLLIADETPLLLDPMTPTDVMLLTFDRTGMPVPVADKTTRPREYERAHRSIEIFHLHRGDFNSKRMAIMTQMEDDLAEADRQARLLDQPSNLGAQSAYNKLLSTLLGCIDPRAEFSRAARAFLGSMRASSTTAALVWDMMP